uniref:Uncharacterized protein n=1 Tax=viral metagenome TaxID=1070528 RepID=A0A6C0EPP2_9ZZZZ
MPGPGYRKLKSIPKNSSTDLEISSEAFNAKKTTRRLMENMKKSGTWMKVDNWLMIAKLVTIVGVIIFAISTASGQIDGELAAYYWMAIGVVTTLVMTTVMLSRESKGEGVFSLITKMAGLYLPSIATLVPIVTMIFIFHTVKNTLSKDAEHLPQQFYTFHYLTFFFLFLQLIMLYQFFDGEINAILSNGKIQDPNKWAFVSAFFFFSIISLGSAAELYVIITRFITDG